jgi:hypothetical protein
VYVGFGAKMQKQGHNIGLAVQGSQHEGRDVSVEASAFR